jgi:acyl-CoA thioesterase
MKSFEKPVHFMMDHDAFSRWLGLSVEAVDEGFCRVSMLVKADMLNGFQILHGGVAFSLADSAMAFAANTHGQLSVVTDAHIQFPASATKGETLIAEARETARSRKKGYYEVSIREKESQKLIARYQGSVYIRSAPIPPEPQQ